MNRGVCATCGSIAAPAAPRFDASTARVDGFGSLHLGGITVHDWGGDPQLDWPDDRGGPWRFYGLLDWSPDGYPTAEAAARAAWFDAMDPIP